MGPHGLRTATDYIRWQKGYAAWLDSHAAQKAFPTVNALCRSIGNIAYYYQGRVIENCRIADRTDGYSVNGWEDQEDGQLLGHRGYRPPAQRRS